MKPLKILLFTTFMWIALPMQLLGQEYISVTAGDGDGIWSLLRENGVAPSPEAVSDFKSTNSDRLKGRDILHSGKTYLVPSSSRVYPIFGSKYERVQILTDRLEGHVYYVVSGHGGPDPGTLGKYDGQLLPEDEIAYDTSLRLARNLIQDGATVYIIVRDENDGIRDSRNLKDDEDEYYLGGERIVLNQSKRLKDRTRIINKLFDKHKGSALSQQMISLHVDAYGSRVEPQIDVHFKAASDSGYQLSRSLRDTMKAKYAQHQPGRHYKGHIDTSTNLYVLNNTKPPAVLVELGNIRHSGDQHRLVKYGNRQALADWLRDGLVKNAQGVTS